MADLADVHSNSPPRPADQVSPPVLRIEPSGGRVGPALREAWHARELLVFLAWRDIKVRYKQTALGAAWAIMQPLLSMAIFTLVFGRLAKVPSAGFPYPLFVLCGLIPWQLFSFALTESSNSLVSNKSLITKVYFPRLIVPAASVVAGLVDFCVSFLLLTLVMLGYGVFPGTRILVLPLLVGFAVLTALSVGFWLSALNVKYRDVRYLIPFLTQFWLFATPIAYTSDLVPERYRFLWGLNPMAGVVEGFRWALLGTPASGMNSLFWGSGVAVVLLLFTGVRYFRRMEKHFADLV